MTFDDLKYTEDTLLKQLSLIELHGTDGSALEAGCKCIEAKHLFAIEGLAEEGMGYATSEAQKKYFEEISRWARDTRKKLETEDYETSKEHGLEHCLEKCHGLEKCIEKCHA